ncbi:MAG: HAMP domain-containing histidine kinase [Okeania sp. SIO3I5]|uniref:sensor histidine kinase n=1 Tax=Okeania sp. SIO3I5 TaxID=2607805 RepID=UPI0013B6C6C0|nr:HAMP domain-containing sensor histidine kinase [Okeania sp. SIO3I5]NEQ35746.1 HAMP domain-containing histidine kinase [Okeania sp. SIO3I5]
MAGNDFIFLVLGFGFGLIASKLWSRQESQNLSTPSVESSPEESNSDSEQLENILEQLKHTQLAYQMASEMSKFKAGFLARTAHELRSPINSMIGGLQLVISDLADDPEEEREFVNQAYNSALKTLGLMDEIIYVAKTEHGTEAVKIESLQLTEVFEAVENLTYMQAANRSIRLQISPPAEDVYVLADESRLKQVLVSLIDTAIAQMKEGSVNVSVHPAWESGYVHIWIDDQRPVSAWSESWDLLKHNIEEKAEKNMTVDFQLSPGMRLLMNQNLLGMMNGRLEVLATPSDGEESNFNRTQCSIPICRDDADSATRKSEVISD